MFKKKRNLFIFLVAPLIIGLAIIFYTFFVIYQGVKNNCLEAQKEFNKDCVSSLMAVVKSEKASFRVKNSAVWTLGQLADKKALPFLTELNQSSPKQEKCKLDQNICKYEVEKAVKWCNEGNLTNWMYKDRENWEVNYLNETNLKTKPTLTSELVVKGVQFIPTIIPTVTPKPKTLGANKLFNLVNEYRARNGLKQLVVYSPLCEFAKIRAEQIKNDWSHSGYDQAAGQGALFSTVCPNCRRVGENLAKDYPTEETVLEAWTVASIHKSNLEGDWDWGCAVYSSDNFAIFLFGRKK